MPAKKDISQEILEYLGKHPDASDTSEGITEWWLLNQRISYEMKRVKEAISKLMTHGWIIEIKGKDGTIRYRLNPKKPKATNPTFKNSKTDLMGKDNIQE